MKISINETYLDEIVMRFFDYSNATLLFPEHRVELIEKEHIYEHLQGRGNYPKFSPVTEIY